MPGLLPAAASRWAVHWAANPTLEVYASIFDFCRGVASFNYNVHSSFGSALVWTVHTMRSVDLEGAGSPSTEDIKSRVSYMRVPQFFGDFFESGESSSQATKYCDIVLGLKIVGVEYLNPQNILITVLAARPRDYNPSFHAGSRKKTACGVEIRCYTVEVRQEVLEQVRGWTTTRFRVLKHVWFLRLVLP